MKLKIYYLASRKIPLTRIASELVSVKTEAAPLLFKRVISRSSLRSVYFAYYGIFEAPSDAAYIKEYRGG